MTQWRWHAPDERRTVRLGDHVSLSKWFSLLISWPWMVSSLSCHFVVYPGHRQPHIVRIHLTKCRLFHADAEDWTIFSALKFVGKCFSTGISRSSYVGSLSSILKGDVQISGSHFTDRNQSQLSMLLTSDDGRIQWVMVVTVATSRWRPSLPSLEREGRELLWVGQAATL